ncbi:hypothetical protein OEZ86_011794 [Tetradesmus obliquus]|nr:hypothetical protein OEZ86_011794 [Tetradesmus obliquus]
MLLHAPCTSTPGVQSGHRPTKTARACGSHRPTPFGLLRPRAVSRRNAVQAKAMQSGEEDKKVLRREEEPEEYWVSKSERKGANPLSDPLAIIGLVAIFLPFGLLLIAIATGLIDTSVYR